VRAAAIGTGKRRRGGFDRGNQAGHIPRIDQAIKRDTIDLRQAYLQIGRGWRHYVLRQYADLARADDLGTAVWRVPVCGMTIHDREWHADIIGRRGIGHDDAAIQPSGSRAL